jgi:pyruvate/2-oxoglutarate dehydrogenase complex dihydrolipoamide acyltransferase (E2) component
MAKPNLRENPMQDIKIDEELWASSMLPEGIVERWFIADGAMITAGTPIAEVRIEEALHEITAPASGRLTIVAVANTVVEPGSLLARLAVDERD